MQKLVFPMRESMPYFVCSLRQVDEWKRFQARQSQVFTQAAYDVNAKYVKSPFAKSLKIEDLLRFLDDTVLDIEFMVQLPSIEKCLDQWWKIYAKDKQVLDAEQFRQVYYDLANVLVQAKTENTHKNSVSMVMRASWTKWSPKEVPLAQPEFFRLMFVLAHLMTETNALGDYVTFFQETLAKITRMFHIKAKRSEQRKRKPRTHRKSSIVEIMGRTGSAARLRTASVPSQIMLMNQAPDDPGSESATVDQQNNVDGTSSSSISSGGGGGHGTVNVKMRRVVTLQSRGSLDLGREDDLCADRFVEVLDRRGVYSQRGAAQHVVVDPLVFERQFQDKWKRPAHARTLSTEDTLRELHPVSNKYVPPLCIARLHASPPSQMGSGRAGIRGLLNRHCQSTPALTLKTSEGSSRKHEHFDLDAELKAALAARDEREDDVLRRSLSAVTLKKRIEHNKAHHAHTVRKEKKKGDARDDDRPAPIYLAIST